MKKITISTHNVNNEWAFPISDNSKEIVSQSIICININIVRISIICIAHKYCKNIWHRKSYMNNNRYINIIQPQKNDKGNVSV